jgi:hypothetical protein
MAKKLTSAKARKILHDKEVHGQPLTEKQRRFFGAIASGAKPYKAESGGWLDKYDAPKAQNGIEGTMGGLTDKGFNYNGAWGGPSMQDGGYVDSVLNANKNLDWVKRLYEKNTPSIQIPGVKGRSTHFMESADGRVYPTVVRMKDGKLKYLGDKAYDYADSTKTYIQFPSDKEAQWFGENYKKDTGVLKSYQMGGSLPGSVGFTYARTAGAAPSNGPYAKKTKASAQNGAEMRYYQEGLDFKPKTISQDGTVIDPMGYWNPENVGNPVIIPSNQITMEGVDQPLIGISDTGDIQYMVPGEEYEFEGENVLELPVAKRGVSVNNADAQPIKKLDQLLNFTNYNKPTTGGWLDKYK